jgi:hypothetical protein
MPRPQANPIQLHLPPEIDLDSLPRYIPAPQLKVVITHYFGPISDRTIRERWPLEWRIFNSRLVTDTRKAIAEAQKHELAEA